MGSQRVRATKLQWQQSSVLQRLAHLAPAVEMREGFLEIVTFILKDKSFSRQLSSQSYMQFCSIAYTHTHTFIYVQVVIYAPENPGVLQSVGLQRLRCDLATEEQQQQIHGSACWFKKWMWSVILKFALSLWAICKDLQEDRNKSHQSACLRSPNFIREIRKI